MRVTSGKLAQIDWVVGENDPAAESNRSRNYKRINGEFASSPDGGEKVTADARNAHSGGDDPSKALRQDSVYGFIEAAPSVELDQHGCWDAHWVVSIVSTAHCGANVAMAGEILARPSESRERFCIED